LVDVSDIFMLRLEEVGQSGKGRDDEVGKDERHTEHHQGAEQCDSLKWQPCFLATSSDNYYYAALQLVVGRNLCKEDLVQRGKLGVY
jgi:hypothetical protein